MEFRLYNSIKNELQIVLRIHRAIVLHNGRRVVNFVSKTRRFGHERVFRRQILSTCKEINDCTSILSANLSGKLPCLNQNKWLWPW